jgi:sulfur-oxidizing protein SoxY
MQRRAFLNHCLGAGVAALTVAGLLTPARLLAAWNEAAFAAKTKEDALGSALGVSAMEDSPQVTITCPDLAENGAVVPVTVSTTLPDVESIALLFDKNASPLCSLARIGKGVKPSIGLRIKMGESGEVTGVVKAGGKLYAARKQVKETAGGCG